MDFSAFKSGDRVKLKSGGPMMTVSSIVDDRVECSWFVEGNVQHAGFPTEVLKLLKEKRAKATVEA